MDISDSVQELLRHKNTVIRLFYDIFLDRHPEVRKYFADVNIDHQAVLLTMALTIVEAHYSHNYPATTHYLHVLGYRHHTNGISPELYPQFRECLVETLVGFHEADWTPELSAQWGIALDKAWQTMLEGYRQPYVV